MTTSTASYSYDANGNLMTKTDASGVWQYSWDYENRLTAVTRPDGLIVSYRYDALGRRIERSTNQGHWTRYSYDGADVVLDTNSDGSAVEYGNAQGIDNHLWQRASSGTTLFYVTDQLGSTRALTDSNGNIVEQVSYDSFGDSAGSALTRYGYTGREHDTETGLIYYRARWYDPAAGRFISEDPIGLEGGINLYAYVKNAPTMFRDAFGLREDLGEPDRDPVTGRIPPRRDNHFNWWDYFITDLVLHGSTPSGPCRSWGERWWDSFRDTNQALPGVFAPTGLSILTGSAVAGATGAPSLFQWARAGFSGARMGAAQYTALETGVAAGGSA